MPSLRHELEVATQLARKAGHAALAYFRQPDLTVEAKADRSPVSAADRAAEAAILAGLRHAFPNDGILSEEQADHRSWHQHARAWVVDPLDGTADFIAGRDGFSVMIGLLVDYQPILGVVYQPVTDMIYRGVVGGGAETFSDGHWSPLAPSQRGADDELRLVVTYSHRSPRYDELKAALRIQQEVRKGSVGLKVGLVAAGVHDLYLNPEGHCRLWDTCAPQAILHAAGGVLSDLHGAPLVYDDPTQLRLSRGVLATNQRAHPGVVARIAPLLP